MMNADSYFLTGAVIRAASPVNLQHLRWGRAFRGSDEKIEGRGKIVALGRPPCGLGRWKKVHGIVKGLSARRTESIDQAPRHEFFQLLPSARGYLSV